MYLNKIAIVLIIAIGISITAHGDTCSLCTATSTEVNPGTLVTLYDKTSYAFYETNYPSASTTVYRTWNFYTCGASEPDQVYNLIGISGAATTTLVSTASSTLPASTSTYQFHAPLETGCYKAVLTTYVTVETASGLTLADPCVSLACWKICVKGQCPDCDDAFCDSRRSDFPTDSATIGCGNGPSTESSTLCYEGDSSISGDQVTWHIVSATTTPATTTITYGGADYKGLCFPYNQWAASSTYPVGKYLIWEALWDAATTTVVQFCDVGSVDIVQDPSAEIKE